MRRAPARLAVPAGVIMVLTVALALVNPGTAAAHPLGNFTVNHYTGLTVHPDRVDVLAVVDSAEIPTLQQQPQLDTDGDGAVSGTERRVYAGQQCDQVSAAVRGTVDGEVLRFTVRSAQVSNPPGEAGLPTTRLSCRLSAAASLDEPAMLSLRNDAHSDRIGWREITAVGRGVGLPESPVPERSISDELRDYPDDLLSDPLDVQEVTLRTVPGAASSLGPGVLAGVPAAGGIERLLGWGTDRFTALAGAQLTPLVGVLALLLSLVLGASHAALPGHGKTLIAAYLAGRRGTTRDALLVGGTVTVTHTAGVLVIGLLLSAFATLLGEQLLAWLGVLSGLLVAVIGAGLLRSALRARRAAAVQDTPAPVPALVGAAAGHGHGHTHGAADRIGRPALLGMGVAAGLVPSPSALLVLFAAIGLGRTWFGVLLVLGYGLGMAATLTAVGLLLVRLRDRAEQRLARARENRWLTRMAAATPALTATLVLIVGLGLIARSLTGTV